MRGNILMAGVASLALIAGPALATDIGSSGNMGGMTGGHPGGHPQGPNPGQWGGGSKASSGSDSKAQSSSQKQYSNKTFKQNDTTLGGVYLDPQIAASKSFSTSEASTNGGGGGKWEGGKGGDHRGGGHPQSGHPQQSGGGSSQAKSASGSGALAASFPIGIGPTTLGGFEGSKTNYSSRQQSSASSGSHSQAQTGR